jgi:anti-sigma factor RsiW
MSCRRMSPLLEPFVDGELEPEKVLEVEQHVAECRVCAERVRLNDALRASTRRAVRAAAPVSPEFQERILAAFSAERERQASHNSEHDNRAKMLSWRGIVPLAAAAAITLVWAAKANDPDRKAYKAGQAYQARHPQSLEQVIEDLVDYHLNTSTPQVTEPALLRQFEPEVGVPVRLPSLVDYGARWEGGSVIPVNNLRAASLRYHLGAHRVTVYVYNSSRVPIESSLEQRTVRNEPVYVGTRRGLSIAAIQRRGVGYALTTDLSDRESAELVASLH